MKTYYIYLLIDPRDNIVRYVGCTINPKARLSGHKSSECVLGSKIEKADWVQSLKKENLMPVMRVVDTCQTVDEVRVKEKQVYDAYNYGQMFCADPSRMKYTAKVNRRA